MEFEDLKGIGEATANKLRDAGFTMDNVKDITVESIIENTDIHENQASTIVSLVQGIENTDTGDDDESDTDLIKNNVDYDIKKASKKLVKVFQKSEEYSQITESSDSEAVMYDKWRKNQNKRLIMGG